jgi:hypothetical protein
MGGHDGGEGYTEHVLLMHASFALANLQQHNSVPLPSQSCPPCSCQLDNTLGASAAGVASLTRHLLLLVWHPHSLQSSA